MLDTTIEVPVTLSHYGDVMIEDSPRIVDSFGDETFYCNTCKEEVIAGSEDGPKEDWELV